MTASLNPDPDGPFTTAIRARLAITDRPPSPQRPLTAHTALRCARQIGFRIHGVPQDIPWAAAGNDRLSQGNWIGQRVAEAAVQELDALTEVPFDLGHRGVELGGKVDGLYRHTVLEVKSVTPGAYRWATGGYSSSANRAGPNIEHLTQAALGAIGLDGDSVHIVYVSTDAADNDRLDGIAHWVISLDQILPHVDRHPFTLQPEPVTLGRLALEEASRQQIILKACRDGVLPERNIPGYGPVEHTPPPTKNGDPSICAFCAWRPTCTSLDPYNIVDFRPKTAAAVVGGS